MSRMLSAGRILAIARKEIRHLQRDRLTGGMVLGLPIVMTLLFGYAIDTDVRHLRAALLDEADTAASRALAADAQASQVLDWVARVSTTAQAKALMARGEVAVALHLPADFERRLARGERPLGQLIVDGSDPTILGVARRLNELPPPAAHGRVAGTAAGVAANSRPAPTMGVQPVLEVRPLYNPERRTAVFIVPGLIGVILTLTMVLFTSIALVRERERGNLELLITTPVRSLELMVGKISPYVVIGYVQVSLILLLGLLLFRMPVRGSLADLYLAAGVFIASALTLGLFISTLARTQFQAFQMTYVSFLPQLLLSGYLFPFEGMPRLAQWLSELFPITHFLRIVRAILLRDAALLQLTSDLWPLAAFFVVVLTLATLRFRKRLD